MQSTSPSPLFILIDGHSLAFRAYYAFALSKKGSLRTSSGIPTSVCFGFINSLIQVVDAQQPQCIAIAFDRREPTFRHEADANYKADRQETPEDFIPDLENLKELLSALNLTIVTAAGYEADDVLGTLAKKASETGYQVKIVTGDRDLFQLVDIDKAVSVLYLERNAIKSSFGEGYTEFYPGDVEVKLGIKPTQVVDYKALCGDKSDNIPGVRGIGEKTATKLLQEYGTLDNIYQNIERIPGTLKQKLITGKQDAYHSQHLAQIVVDVPVEIRLEDCQLKGFNLETLKPILQKLEFNKFISQIDKIHQKFGGEVKEVEIIPQAQTISTDLLAEQQLSLFSPPNTQQTDKLIEDKIEITRKTITPQIIDSIAQLDNLVERLQNYTNSQSPVAWDTETTALEPKEADLVGMSCCWGNHPTDVAYIPIGHRAGNQLDKNLVLMKLKAILESQQYPKALQNAKFDRLILYHQGIQLTGVTFDTMLASYVLNPESSHKLSEICQRYLLNITCQNYEDLGIVKGKTIADLDIETVANYCGLDAYVTFLLVDKLKAQLQQDTQLEKLLLEVEQPLEPVLAMMEAIGIKIDINYLRNFSKQLEQDLQTIETQVYEAAGEKFNLGSPKQLGAILFEKLSLNRKKSRKTKTGYSTDAAILEKLQGDHPIIDYILEYRTLSKLKSTYVDALPSLVRPETQRVHTNFNQTVTTTGRLSSSNPNLQNIPIRTEFSRKIRQAFLPREGWQLVSADYSQIELRILAHLTQEPVLINAYQTGEDVHSVTAKLLFEKEQITPLERNMGKTINFGVIYGMGAQRFARQAGVSVEQGKEFINKYHRRYAKVFEYLERLKKEAIANGFVKTILGRRRYFNFITESLRQLRGRQPDSIDLKSLKANQSDAQLLRAAANAPIQGSSADIIKIAMIKLHEILQQYQANLLLQVHDELVFEVPPQELDELLHIIKETMENAVKLDVPLVVEIHSGNNWMEAK